MHVLFTNLEGPMCADAVDDETVAVSEALVTDMIKAGAVAGGTGHFNSLGLCDLRDSSAPSFFWMIYLRRHVRSANVYSSRP